MNVAPAVLNRVVHAIVWVERSGLAIPGAFAAPWLGDGGAAPAERADSANPDAPVAGRGAAG